MYTTDQLIICMGGAFLLGYGIKGLKDFINKP
jgi:hypothetical protein